MTARELIVALTKVDPDSAVRLYGKDDFDRCPLVVGVDPYAGATMLVADTDGEKEGEKA